MKTALKLALIGLLCIVLAVPILMLQGLVYERQNRGREVAADIANSSSRPQALTGPLLLVQVETVERQVRMFDNAEGERRSEEKLERNSQVHVVTPTALRIDGDLATEIRRRGIFEALVYLASMRIDAEFAPWAVEPPSGDIVERRITGAWLALGLGDARGVRAIEATLDGEKLDPEPGTGLAWQSAGLNFALPPARLALPIRLGLTLDLAGTESLHWLPVAEQTDVTLRSAWPHPSFNGVFLPDSPKVGDDGFEATWRVSGFAAEAQQQVQACDVAATSCVYPLSSGFGVKLIDPVDRYLETDRAIKYAWLFIVVVFGALFFLELLRPGVRVHPLQYGLTGLALAMFFLLLLSLSEHIGFGPAYLLAAVACCALIAAYLAVPFGSAKRATLFAGLLGALYGLLYGVLQSEDYALLMGSLALFGLLAGGMLLSRRIDWFRLGQATA